MHANALKAPSRAPRPARVNDQPRIRYPRVQLVPCRTRTPAGQDATCNDPLVITLEYWPGVYECSLRLELFQLDGLDLPGLVSIYCRDTRTLIFAMHGRRKQIYLFRHDKLSTNMFTCDILLIEIAFYVAAGEKIL